MCEKKQYQSVHQARMANSANNHRLHCYRCPECKAIHVSKNINGATTSRSKKPRNQ